MHKCAFQHMKFNYNRKNTCRHKHAHLRYVHTCSSGYIRHTHLHTGFNNTYRHTYIGTHSYVCNLNANITPHIHQTHVHNLTITGKHIQAHTHIYLIHTHTFQHMYNKHAYTRNLIMQAHIYR